MDNKNAVFSLRHLVKGCCCATVSRMTACLSAIYPPPYHRLNFVLADFYHYKVTAALFSIFRCFSVGDVSFYDTPPGFAMPISEQNPESHNSLYY